MQSQSTLKRTVLTQARLKQGLTALDLAGQLGISENRVYAIERGRTKPRVEEALLWAGKIKLDFDTAFPDLKDVVREGFQYLIDEINKN